MDYTAIVLRGYFDPNNRKFLTNYFIRECKIAEQQFYTKDEFYTGCTDAIRSLQLSIELQYLQRKAELEIIIKQDESENDLEPGNYCNIELEKLKKENFAAALSSFAAGTFHRQIHYSQIQYIEKALNDAVLLSLGKEQNEANHELENEDSKETIECKINRLLNPLKAAFDDPEHITRISHGLLELLKNGICNQPVTRLCAKYENLMEFYEPFVKVWHETGLTPSSISEVLTRYLYMHNGKLDAIAPATIRKNIYECNKKLRDRTSSEQTVTELIEK